jgi:hypothetical protein
VRGRRGRRGAIGVLGDRGGAASDGGARAIQHRRGRDDHGGLRAGYSGQVLGWIGAGAWGGRPESAIDPGALVLSIHCDPHFQMAAQAITTRSLQL